MNQDDVRKRAFAMPLTNPAFPPGPYRFINREYLIITYRTDPAKLRGLVPEPLEITEPHVKYEFIRMPDSTGFGDYTETGQVKMLRHVTVDDAGTVVNPVLTEGQRHGGIAQGAAQALLEEVLYDADGNPLTSTLADYAAVSASDLPSFELVDSETPTDLNPLGVKGIGEAGTIGSTPAIQNAVVDAVSHLGIRHIDMPTTPQRVWTAITTAQKASHQ